MIKLNRTASATAEPAAAVAFTAPHDREVSGAAGELGPTAEELSAIEVQWPLIEAEMNLVGAEIRVLTAGPHPTEIDWRRLRRAEDRVAREARALSARTSRSCSAGRAA